MITFLYGIPGSGKSTEILKAIKEDAERGTPSFLIVPEQEAVSAERTVFRALPPEAQLSTEVLNFSRLANLVFRSYGGLSYHYIDKGAKALLLYKTLSELSPFLSAFDQSKAADPALSSELLTLFSELKASSVGGDALAAAGRKLDPKDPLSEKMNDLALLYEVYTSSLRASFDDKEDDLHELSRLLSIHSPFRGANIYIDSFTSFTAIELEVIGKLGKGAENLTVALPLAGRRSDQLECASVLETANRLAALFPETEYKLSYRVLGENKRAKDPALAFLVKQLWRLNVEAEATEKTGGAITVATAKDPYREVEYAAYKIALLVRSGYRYRDILLVTRNASALSGIFELILPRYRIPYYLSEKEDLLSLAPMKLLFSALSILEKDYRREDVITYLKTGLTGVDPSDADLFEEYTATWRLSGKELASPCAWDRNPDGYVAEISPRGRVILDAANRAKDLLFPPLRELGEGLKTASCVKDECDALLAYLEAVKLDSSLSALCEAAAARGEIRRAEILSRLYPLLVKEIEKISRFYPEEEEESRPLGASGLLSALRILFENSEIGTIPTAVDEVTVGSANLLRASNVKCAIVIGLNEGEFPASVSDEGLLTAAERETLSGLGIALSGSDPFRSSDELLYVTRAFSLPSEKLILSAHESGSDGRATRPSLAYLRVKRLFPGISVEREEEIAKEQRILTLEKSIDLYASLRGTATGEALLALYREKGLFPGIEEAARTPVSDAVCRIPEEVVGRILGPRFSLSQSRMEKFVSCHFSYYCSYILALREKKIAEFDAANAGSFLHRVLEVFFREAMGEGGKLPSFTREEILTLANRAVESYRAEILPPSIDLGENGRLAHLYRRLRDLSVMMISNILDEFSSSEFVPRFFELQIGGPASPAPLSFSLKDGTVLTCKGVIDRVDLCRKEGKLYVRVVDYKTGTKDFSLSDLQVGKNLQLLIYLFALARSKRFFGKAKEEEGCEILPVGALYHSSALSPVMLDRFPDREGNETDEGTEAEEMDIPKLAEKNFSRSGILPKDEYLLSLMNSSLDPDFLAGVKKGKSGLVGRALIPKDAFPEIEREVSETVVRIAETLKSGNADAAPLLYKGTNPCTYCTMRPICRRTDLSIRTGKEEDDGETKLD